MRTTALVLALSFAACSRGGTPPAANAPAAGGALRNDDEKTLYALGQMLGTRLEDFALAAPEIEIVQRGMRDKLTGAPSAVPMEQFGPRIGQMARARQQTRATRERQAGEAYLARAAAEPGAQRLPSGVIYRETQAGTGAQPTASDRVRVHYRGTLTNGTEFDSSYSRNEPAEFPLNGVIPCWTEGVQRMKVGGKARLVCPSSQAYGDNGQRNIPPGSTLVFEIELLAVQPPAAPPPGMPGLTPPAGNGAPAGHP